MPHCHRDAQGLASTGLVVVYSFIDSFVLDTGCCRARARGGTVLESSSECLNRSPSQHSLPDPQPYTRYPNPLPYLLNPKCSADHTKFLNPSTLDSLNRNVVVGCNPQPKKPKDPEANPQSTILSETITWCTFACVRA